jgi:hypothetical protein
MVRQTHLGTAALALLLALSACGSDKDAELDQIDQQLIAKKNTDPAVNEALEGQIMVDPSLASQSNEHSVRPANQPNAGALPVTDAANQAAKPGETLGSMAQEQARIAQESFAGCQLDVGYSMDFAAKAPTELPLFPKSRVTEAAGSDAANCKLRAISYNAPAPVADLVGYYKGLAQTAGYSFGDKLSGEDHIVTGKRAADGGAFYAILKPAGGGTSVDLVANNGR